MKKIIYSLLLMTLSLGKFASAETIDFGGYSERYKGGGDKIPPRCTLDLPRASTEPFFIKWYCVDDNSSPEQIRSELWLYRKDSPTGILIANFLGFPASVQVDQGLLGSTTTFSDGLPVSFKLLAKDTAGITTISPLITVRAQDNSLSTCDMSIIIAATESTAEHTGTPELKVIVNDATVNVSEIKDNKLTISTSKKAYAETCQIDKICSDKNFITFTSNITISQEAATATTSISPGNLLISQAGTTTINSLSLENIELTGHTTIEGSTSTNVTVSLSCSK